MKMNKRKLTILSGIILILNISATVFAIPVTQNQTLRSGIQSYAPKIVLDGNGITQQGLIDEIKNLDLYNLDTVKIMKSNNKYTLTPTYYETQEQINQVYKLASRVAEEVKGVNERDKVLYTVQRVAGLIKYDDNEGQSKFSPYASIQGYGVCQGYARFTDIVLKQMGIKTNLVIGDLNGTPHMWNNVTLNGVTYAIDVTSSDIDEAGIIEWSYIFMNSEELNSKGYTVNKSTTKASNVPFPNKLNNQGLISLKTQSLYTRVTNGLVSLPLNKVKTLDTVSATSVDKFYVVGGDLIILQNDKLTLVNSNKELMINVKEENIKNNGVALSVNDEVIYAPVITPKDKNVTLNGDFDLKFSKSGYETFLLEGRVNIFFKNNFVLEIIRR